MIIVILHTQAHEKKRLGSLHNPAPDKKRLWRLRVSAATTNVLLSAEPIFGAVFAKFLFGDVLGPKGKIGALLIVAGCVLAGAADED